MPSLTGDAVELNSDSLTGEDSLLDCSLLPNPSTDLLDEFAPIAISAPAHKGKFFLLVRPTHSRRTEELLRVFLIKSLG